MATEQEVGRILTMLSAAYPNFALPKETIGVYCRLLADLDPRVVEAAAIDHVSKSKWFPTVAELRDAAQRLTEGEGDVTGPEAWALVRKEMRRVGYMGTPEFPELVEPAIECVGGWRYLCLSEDQVPDRMRFIQAYDQLVSRKRQDARTLPQLKGSALKLLKGAKDG